MNIRWSINLLLLILLSSCSNNDVREEISIAVITPYNCRYQFTVLGKQLHASSTSVQFNKPEIGETHIDTLFQEQKIVLSDKEVGSLRSIASRITDTSRVKRLKGDDAYFFEFYRNERLVRRSIFYDKDIFSMIDIYIPHLDTQQLACCDFFRIFADARKYEQ